MDPVPGEITRLLQAWSRGDEAALERLVELAYDDLRAIARRQLRGGSDARPLRTTALVHEAYVRLARVDGADWPSRGHFFAFCARAMRHVLVDYSRRHLALKRGGERVRVPLDGVSSALEQDITDVLAVEEALRRLQDHDERMARVVECRFFGGLTVSETAEALDTSVRTVERDWQRARVYLYRCLEPEPEPEAEEEEEEEEEGGPLAARPPAGRPPREI